MKKYFEKKNRAAKIAAIFAALLLFVPLFTSASVMTAPNNLGLIGYWNFSEDSGSVAHDASGNKITGTLENSPTWVSGKLGTALSFNGTNQYILGTGNNLPNVGTSASVTITAWVKLSSVSTVDTVFTQGQSGNCFNYGMTIGSGVFKARNTNNDYSLGATLSIGQWYQLAIVYNSSGATGYVNGVQTGQSSSAVTQSCADTHWVIGQRAYNAASENFNGSIDEVRVYNRALGASEVASLYKDGAAQFQSPNNNGLVGYWSFNEGAGTIAHDASGNKNNGTLVGSPTWVNGKLGSALSFTSSYVDIPTNASLDLANTFSVSAWIYLRSNGSNVFLTKGSPTVFGAAFAYGWSGGGFEFIANDSANAPIATPSSTDLNRWHFLTGTVSAGGVRTLYVDGVLIGTNGSGASSWNNAADLRIGQTDYGATNASFDDVRVYNRVLGASEVASLYKDGASQFNAPSPLLQNGSSLQNGLVGLWTMDGVDTNWKTDIEADRSGNGNTGSLALMSTTTSPVAGKVGQAMSFNGVNQYMNAPSITLNSATGFTAALWFKTSASGDEKLISNNAGSHPLQIFSGHLRVCFSACAVGSTVIDDGKWHYAVVVASGGTLNAYLDGNTTPEVTVSDSTTLSGTLTIGAVSGGGSFYYNGSIDDVHIYNRGLSATEVKQLYLLGH